MEFVSWKLGQISEPSSPHPTILSPGSHPECPSNDACNGCGDRICGRLGVSNLVGVLQAGRSGWRWYFFVLLKSIVGCVSLMYGCLGFRMRIVMIQLSIIERTPRIGFNRIFCLLRKLNAVICRAKLIIKRLPNLQHSRPSECGGVQDLVFRT